MLKPEIIDSQVVRHSELEAEMRNMMLSAAFVSELNKTLRISGLSSRLDSLKSELSHQDDKINSFDSRLRDRIDNTESRLRSTMTAFIEEKLDGKISSYVPKVLGKALVEYLAKHDDLIRLQSEVIASCRGDLEYHIREILHKITQEDQYHLIFDAYSKTLQTKVDSSLETLNGKMKVVEKALGDEVKSLNLRADSSFTEIRAKQDTMLEKITEKEKMLEKKMQQVTTLQWLVGGLGVILTGVVGYLVYKK